MADRLRMESCAHSLVNEGKSLMLYCPSSALRGGPTLTLGSPAIRSPPNRPRCSPA